MSMDHKTWLWKRKSSEKIITTNEKSDISLTGNEQEKEKALELERSLEDIKEQLSSVLSESIAKDDLLAKQKKVAEEATAGWEKAVTEAESLKKELADSVLQKAAAEERIASIDSILKECMQQLHVDRDEQQHSINDAATKMSRLQEKARELEKNLGEKNNSLGKLGVEHSNMSRILEVKEKLIEDLSKSKSQAEASFTVLVARLDALEKDNASLNYEVCMLQKEIDIRNQDRDFHLKSADAAHKQYLESTRKIAKLESQCQRLRVMVRKRLPGPAAVAKMRCEVEILGDSTVDVMRKMPMLAPDDMMSRVFLPVSDCDSCSRKVGSLIERLHAVEDENKILKETLVMKNNELQSSRIMFARTASKLSQAETQLEEFLKRQISLDLTRSSFSNDLPLPSISEDGGNEDAISCAESWASALISELEHFRNGKTTRSSTTTAAVSELGLMDDFIEMEKLAVVFVDEHSGEWTPPLTPKGIDSELISSKSTGKEIVPINTITNPSGTNNGLPTLYKSFDMYPRWLQDILWVVIQKHHITNKSLDVILNEVSVALGLRHISSNSPDSTSILPNEPNKQQFRPDLEKPLRKLIELIEGVIQRSFTDNIGRQILSGKYVTTATQHKSFSPTGHVARIFQWEISELCTVLQHFTVVCNDMLHGKAEFVEFTYELASTLEWLINHCFPLQGASNMEESIKKVFSLDVPHGDGEFKAVISKMKEPEELMSRNTNTPALSTVPNGLCKSQIEETESKLKDENMRLMISEIRDIESSKKDLEKRLELASAKNDSLSTQLKESDERISSLQAEPMTLKYSNMLIDDRIENQKLITEDLGTQLTVVNAELNEARQKFSREAELENKINCCEELEVTPLELQLQCGSVATMETRRHDKGQEEKQLRSVGASRCQDWEISAASEKLAECQATILNLGNQLKALATPNDAALFDKVIPATTATRFNRRPQLFDQMQAEAETTSEHLKSPKTKEIICTEIKLPPFSSTSENNPNAGLLYGRKLQANAGQSANSATVCINQPSHVQDDFKKKRGENDMGRLVLVPKRHKGGTSFLKKLLSRRKKESSMKNAPPLGS